MFDQSDIIDFREKILLSSHVLLPNIHVRLECNGFFLNVILYDEKAGDLDHVLKNGEYDPKFMFSRIDLELATIKSEKYTIVYSKSQKLPKKYLKDNTEQDMLKTFDSLVLKLLQKLYSFGLPTSKDYWKNY